MTTGKEHRWAGPWLLAVVIALMALHGGAADDPTALRGVVDDVVTAKVVSITIEAGEAIPGAQAIAKRDGKQVATLKVKTATGIMQVTEGDVKVGDRIEGIAAAGSDTATTVAPATDVPWQLAEEAVDARLRPLLLAQGELAVADFHYHGLEARLRTPLDAQATKASELRDRLNAAARVLRMETREDRVAAALRDQGDTELARIISPDSKAEQPLAPILPADTELRLASKTYGEALLINPDPRLWAQPQFWGRDPFPASFSGWQLELDKAQVSATSEALIRDDFMLDDMEVSGEVQPGPEGFVYVILRSQIVVRFSQQQKGDSYGSVAVKYGYNNLNNLLSTYASDEWIFVPLLKPGKWVGFTCRLQGKRLKVMIDGQTIIDSTVRGGRTVMPDTGYVGLGSYRGGGAFRDMRVKALTDTGSRALPLFDTSESYEADGAAVDLLDLPAERFVSLVHHETEDYRPDQHAVKDGTLAINGAAFSQFAVKGTEGDHWRVSGRVQLDQVGSVWFRANRYMLMGLRVQDPERRRADQPDVMAKFNTGDFRSFDEGFPGQELTARRWYNFEIEFHDPIAVLKIDDRPVLTAVARRPADVEDRRAGPNQWGVSAYGTTASLAGLRYQKLKPAGKSVNPDRVRRLFVVGLAQVETAKTHLASLEHPNAAIALAILNGERPPALADSDDFTETAMAFRETYDWPTYLDLLAADYKRFPEGDPQRDEREKRWNKERQKYDEALKLVGVGEIGLDNIVRVGDIPGPVAVDADRQHVWIALRDGQLCRLDPATREIDRRLKPAFTVAHLVPRAGHLVAVTEDGKSLRRLDPVTGKATKTATIDKGRILDAVGHPRLPITYVTVDENETNRQFHVQNYKIYALNETDMSLTFSGGYGQFLAVDPMGRYVYAGLSVPVAQGMDFDPGGLNVQPVGGWVDHLLAYTADGTTLLGVGEKATPGVQGGRIIVDGQGRSLIYLGRQGIFDAFDPDMQGAMLAALRTTAVSRVLGTYSTGPGLEMAAFHPSLPTLYTVVNGELRIFNARTHEQVRTAALPPVVKDCEVQSLTVTPGGRYLMIGYAGRPGGIYLFPLDGEAGDATGIDDGLLANPREALDAALAMDAGDDRLVQLQSLAENFAFTALGDEAAAAYLAQLDSPYASETAPAFPVEPLTWTDLPTAPTWASLVLPDTVQADGASQREDAVHGDDPDFRETVVDLHSFEETAGSQPWSWLFECQRQERRFANSVQLKLLAAKRLQEMDRPAAVAVLAGQVLELSEGKGWSAFHAWRLLAWTANRADDPGHELAALEQARRILPRNAVLHRDLGRFCASHDLPNRARYHDLVSVKIYPSQPTLVARLRAADAMPPDADTPELDIPTLFRRQGPSVVLVRQGERGAGTGFFVSRDGMILTNQHVIGEGESITVVIDEGETEHTLPAMILARDRVRDMALLQVNLGDIQVEPLILGDPKALVTGARVVVIGNPGMGAEILTKSVTEGIVSKTKRQVGGQTYIQTSAAVNPGNSGGPMFNTRGEVVGMVTLKAVLDNVGFAIPTDALLRFTMDNL